MYPLARGILENAPARSFDEISTLDLYNELIAGDGDYLIRTGMGNFVSRELGTGVAVQTGTPVTAIERGPGGVKVITTNGTVPAKAVIVTVPVGVLAANTILFTPALPQEYIDAFAALPMGNLEKIALAFSADVFPPPLLTTVFQFTATPPAPVALAPFWTRNYAVALVSGSGEEPGRHGPGGHDRLRAPVARRHLRHERSQRVHRSGRCVELVHRSLGPWFLLLGQPGRRSGACAAQAARGEPALLRR